jgi:hypothetical protein
MNSNNQTARIVGALFLAVNVTFLLGAVVLLEPLLSAPDYLTLVSANRTQVILGVLLELTNGLAYLGIAVLMFPILKQQNVSIALGYVGFRFVEFIMQIASDISPLLMLNLSEEFVKAGAPESSSFQTLGTLLLAERYWAFQMVYLTFTLGALMFYYLLYRSKLIPRFISVWGLIAAVLVFANTILDMFGLRLDAAIGIVTGLPMLLNELFLGVWLIAKGFNPSPVTSAPSSRT